MAASGPKFADLAPRAMSAAVLLAVAGAGLWLGGMVLALLLSLLGALMLWEYFRLIIRLPPRVATLATGATALLQGVALVLEDRLAVPVLPPEGEIATPMAWNLAPSGLALAVLALSMLTVVAVVRRSRLETLFGAMIPLANFLFFYLHQSVPLAMWLVVATVIATDVAGYVFGKLIGGPKFWPALSPNKTWAGTVSGWVCAVLIAMAVALGQGGGNVVVGAAFLLLVAVSAQMADIAESALKRRAGVKDSSRLLPGHGGVLDRFDGMLGGFTVAGLAFMLIGYAMVPG